MDAGHDHRAALEQRQGGSHLGVLVAVAHLHVGGAGQALARLHQEPHQGKQHLTGLFVRQRQQRCGKFRAASVYIAPFTRLDGIRVVRDPCAFGLEACRKVSQRACVDQLAQGACGGLAQASNEVHKAQTVGTWAFDKHVMHKIIAAQAFFVVFLPISTDSDHFERVLGQCDDIGQLDAGRFAVFVLVFKALEVQIDQLLKQKHLSLVIRGPNTGNFVNCLTNLACIGRRGIGIQEHVQVFPC